MGRKSWFYFKAKVTEPMVLRFTIENVGVLQPGYQNRLYPEGCVFKEEDKEEWKPVPSSFMTVHLPLRRQTTRQSWWWTTTSRIPIMCTLP